MNRRLIIKIKTYKTRLIIEQLCNSSGYINFMLFCLSQPQIFNKSYFFSVGARNGSHSPWKSAMHARHLNKFDNEIVQLWYVCATISFDRLVHWDIRQIRKLKGKKNKKGVWSFELWIGYKNMVLKWKIRLVIRDHDATCFCKGRLNANIVITIVLLIFFFFKFCHHFLPPYVVPNTEEHFGNQTILVTIDFYFMYK